MPKIAFTQFMPPNGEQRAVEFERPEEIVKLARKIVDDGCSLQIELLSTGYVSATIFDPAIEDDIGIEIAANGDMRQGVETIDGDNAMAAIDNVIRNYKGRPGAPKGFDGDDAFEKFRPEKPAKRVKGIVT